VDGGAAQRRNSGGAGAARRSVHTEIPVQCGIGVGEEEVDGAPDSKAKPWRRLAEAERRQKSVSTAAQVLCSDSGNTGGGGLGFEAAGRG
jgi:hypothetical protein